MALDTKGRLSFWNFNEAYTNFRESTVMAGLLEEETICNCLSECLLQDISIR